ncbi:MAG: glycosyltransferase family 1 protein, partial [Chitinophagaceae bacterium]
MKRLAIVVTHPIQYYAPVFQALTASKQVELKVFYTWGEGSVKKFDPDFKKVIEWDIPLLEGYAYEFLTNKSSDPGTHHFRGII